MTGVTDFFVSRVSNRASGGSSLLIPFWLMRSTAPVGKLDFVAKDDSITDETLGTELYVEDPQR